MSHRLTVVVASLAMDFTIEVVVVVLVTWNIIGFDNYDYIVSIYNSDSV